MSHDQHGCLFALQHESSAQWMAEWLVWPWAHDQVGGCSSDGWGGGVPLLLRCANIQLYNTPGCQSTYNAIEKSLSIRPWAVLCKANCAQFYHPLCACHGIFKIVQNCMINCLVYMWEVVLQKKWLDLANLSASFEWKISLRELLVALFDLSGRSNTNFTTLAP